VATPDHFFGQHLDARIDDWAVLGQHDHVVFHQKGCLPHNVRDGHPPPHMAQDDAVCSGFQTLSIHFLFPKQTEEEKWTEDSIDFKSFDA